MVDRKNRLVLKSIETDDGLRCVDIYRGIDGLVCWDEWRRDPEDPTGWHATGAKSTKSYETEMAARDAAIKSVNWLEG